MNSLVKEFYNVQNPALGAYLLALFSEGYVGVEQNMVPMPLLFIVLPMVYKREITEFILTTQKKSGLRYFSEKFTEKKNLKNDLIIQVQNTSHEYKILTLESLQIALTGKLVMMQEGAYILPLTENIKEYSCNSENVKNMAKAAEKLGVWCADLSLAEISQILKVRF